MSAERDRPPDAPGDGAADAVDAPDHHEPPVADPAAGRSLAAWFRQNRARIEILAIGAVAIGGIVCMCLATLLIVWRLGNE